MASSSSKITIEELFEQFAKFGDKKSTGQQITLTNIDKWMKQANIFNKKLTTTDTGIAFKKFKTKTIDFDTFKLLLEDLAKTMKIDVAELIKKLEECGAPGTTKTTKTDDADAVNRLTDTKTYTGTHKERFDDEGKGKGIEGRSDVDKNDGYVQGYNEKDTYDKKK